MVDIHHAVAADLPHVAITLGRAFVDDPLFGGWMFRTVPDKLDAVTTVFRLFAASGLQTGHLYTLPHYEAVAHWVPPDASMMTPANVAVFGETIATLLGPQAERVLAGLGAVAEARPREEPHFYLVALGTAPEHQNRGLGGQLLRQVLQRCDVQGLPAYLESTNPRNRPLYERQGFRLFHEIPLPEGPAVVGMWREPRRSASEA